jgi:hypothetical protein
MIASPVETTVSIRAMNPKSAGLDVRAIAMTIKTLLALRHLVREREEAVSAHCLPPKALRSKGSAVCRLNDGAVGLLQAIADGLHAE